MKKMKILSILLFVSAIAIYLIYGIYEKKNSDEIAPVLQCETEALTVSVSATEEELLQGVTAKDDKSGNVEDTLVIESISSFTEENTRMITYAAIDEKGNVGRVQRTLSYEDYQKPRFDLKEPLRFSVGGSINFLNNVSADSVLDGNLTDKIKYTLESSIDLKSTGVYQVEYRVMDSAGSVVYLPLEVEVYDPTEERIHVILTDYLVYLPQGAQFTPNAYFVGSDIEGTLTVTSGVDTRNAGVYFVDYVVTSENSIGKSRLVVVVTES